MVSEILKHQLVEFPGVLRNRNDDFPKTCGEEGRRGAELRLTHLETTYYTLLEVGCSTLGRPV